jgi:glycosyltransferase involved in cell wall biosynthesis
MKVLHLATCDWGEKGGASGVAYRLHLSMLEAGIDSQMIVKKKYSNQKTIHEVSVKNKLYFFKELINKIKYKIIYLSRTKSYFGLDNSISAKEILSTIDFSPDFVVATWVGGFVNKKCLAKIGAITGAKVYWYCMDMAPITGGCHYSLGCNKYNELCGDCPQLGILGSKNDSSKKQILEKISANNIYPVEIITASNWSFVQAKNAVSCKGAKVHKLLLGVDPTYFKLDFSKLPREKLGIDPNKKVIFFAAHNLHEKRKGFSYAIEILSYLKDILIDNNNVLILVAGWVDPTSEVIQYFNCKYLGVLKSDAELASAYQASDIFLSTSIDDAGPVMINEAIMCGTLVASFNTGVAEDLVQDGISGEKTNIGDTKLLAKKISNLLMLTREELDLKRINCADYGFNNTSVQKQINEIIKIFKLNNNT